MDDLDFGMEIVLLPEIPVLQPIEPPVFARQTGPARRKRPSENYGPTMCVYEAPPPSKSERWNGLLCSAPAPWCSNLRLKLDRRLLAEGGLIGVCMSCRTIFALPDVPGIVALARASDHDRHRLNHQIVILDEDWNELARSDFHPLRASW